MMTPMIPMIWRACLVLLALITLPTGLVAQERLRTFTEGDGRIHGAPSLQVSEVDLHPGQVQTINLHAGFHTMLEFPFPVVQVDAGDPDLFLASIIGNKVSLKATRLDRSETTMTVILADADLTVISFNVRTDPTQPMLSLVRYTDPVSRHLNEAEQRIAERLASENEARVNELAELLLQQKLLWAGDVESIRKSVTVGQPGERLRLEIENTQTFVGDDNTGQAYMRYNIENGTITPLEDLYFIVRVVTHKRKFLFFEKRTERELYDVRDIRIADPIPAGTRTRGLLIFQAPDLAANQSIDIEAVAFNDQRHLVVKRVVTGR